MGVNEIIKVGNNIKSLRKKRGLTQKHMASLLNIPSSTYSNYENNNREPSKDILFKVAKVLEVNICDLLSINKSFDSIQAKDIYIPEESMSYEKVNVVEKLIELCGFNVNFNKLQKNDPTLNEYLKLEIKNNLIPLVYINKCDINLNLNNDQFKNLSDKIVQLVTFEVNELIKDA